MDNPAIFALESHLTIADVERMQQKIESLLLENQQVVVDASQLEKIDASGMQLLCSLKKTLKHVDGDLQWKNTSLALGKAAGVLGLETCLGLV